MAVSPAWGGSHGLEALGEAQETSRVTVYSTSRGLVVVTMRPGTISLKLDALTCSIALATR